MIDYDDSRTVFKLGKIGKYRFVCLTTWPTVPVQGITILCPALRGLPPADALTLAMLPIHDANGLLLDELAGIQTKAADVPPPDFAAVCLSDPFRRIEDIFNAVRDAGIGGIINLPSIVALMTSSNDRTFGALYDRESKMLEMAANAGFRVVRVACHDGEAEDGEIRHADPDSFVVL